MSGMGTEARDASGTGRRARRPGLIALAVLVFAIGMATLAGGAGAVHDLNIFELDGNIADGSGGGAPDDWATLFPTNTSPQFVVARSFVSDGTGAADTGFTGGQSKDTENVSGWGWSAGQVTPAKNNIANAYAAGYVDPQGHLILYFGQDRLSDQTGDASMGFWFLQDDVHPVAGGSFSGSHQTGDILIQTDLTNGGGISRIDIYKWDNGLVNISGSGAGECGSGLSGDTACGIANSGPVTPPWSYPGGSILSPYFFEGGVDVTKALGGSTPCFGSFLANTRTSQSESAVLKDFAGGVINTLREDQDRQGRLPGGRHAVRLHDDGQCAARRLFHAQGSERQHEAVHQRQARHLLGHRDRADLAVGVPVGRLRLAGHRYIGERQWCYRLDHARFRR